MAPMTTWAASTMRDPQGLRRSVYQAAATLALLASPANAQSQTATLPAPVSTALGRAGCRLPAAPSGYGPDSAAAIPNVAYRASFLSATSEAWAVVCEVADHREILVYALPVSPTSQPAARLRIEWTPGEEGCDGWIALADRNHVRAALAKQRARIRPPLDRSEAAQPLHAGIIDSMCEGSSTVVRYWTGRRWIAFQAYSGGA